MALPASPPITSEMIRQQYGGSLPFRIQDYYRGGARVPNVAGNAGVPTSGVISFANFLGQGGGGGGGALTASSSNVNGFVFQNEPAPASRTVTADGNVFASGGTGTYTCTWAHLSGSTAIPTPAANTFNPSYSATVSKNTELTAVKRCTVSDGVNTPATTDMTVRLAYSTDL